jgi:hypothetical protein
LDPDTIRPHQIGTASCSTSFANDNIEQSLAKEPGQVRIATDCAYAYSQHHL